ncbi:MAG: hypothetical protein LBG52_01130 [Candidatus Peribacteria bacterium]|nr:hypothetical protein [Candidatus Peribacteria bacterium]
MFQRGIGLMGVLGSFALPVSDCFAIEEDMVYGDLTDTSNTNPDDTTIDTLTHSNADDTPIIAKVVSEEVDGNVITFATVTPAASTYPNCDTPDLIVGTYTIAACNVGATQAGTGSASYGDQFQWGNNYPFPNTGSIPTSSMQVDTANY